jgi:RNA polymerase sigma-70 factor (ECF subfamily)
MKSEPVHIQPANPLLITRNYFQVIINIFLRSMEKMRTFPGFFSLKIRENGIERGDDRDLVTAFLNGDMKSFETIVERYRDMIFNLCYNIMKDYDEAGDCAQDVFIKMHKNIHRFEFRSSLSTWLYSIAVNTCRNRLSASYFRRVFPMGEGGMIDFLHRDGDNPAADFEKTEKEEAVRQAVAKLPDEERILIVLRDFEGRDYEEISVITGVKTGTIKSRISRGRHRLRGLLEGVLP